MQYINDIINNNLIITAMHLKDVKIQSMMLSNKYATKNKEVRNKQDNHKYKEIK